MAESVKVLVTGWQIPAEVVDKKVDFWPNRVRHVEDKISLLTSKEAASDMGIKKSARSDEAGSLFSLFHVCCLSPVSSEVFVPCPERKEMLHQESWPKNIKCDLIRSRWGLLTWEKYFLSLLIWTASNPIKLSLWASFRAYNKRNLGWKITYNK